MRARKSPLLKAYILLAGSLVAASSPAAGQALDSAQLRKQAARAESEYEGSIRRYAPIRFAAPRDRPCDEIVGRYCIYYEAGGDSLPEEPAEIGAARARAIEALSAAHAVSPARSAVAYPLVRYLSAAGRAGEAVTVARSFAGASGDRAAAHMLLGYALHAAGDTRAAAVEFEAWVASLPQTEREEVRDPGWLLDRKERQRYERLPAEERQSYDERLWRYADPLFLTPGNEAWTDHMARQALARMLASRRGIAGADSWGDDVHQLTVRFGLPVRTTRYWQSGSLGRQYQYTEHWDQTLRTYVTPELERALQRPARLDTIWPLDSLTARSGHAPPPIRVMQVLEHQAALFRSSPEGLLIKGVARRDTVPVSDRLEAAVFVLDSTLMLLGRTPAAVSVFDDSLVFTAFLPLPPGARYYSAEIYDAGSRFAARARYAVHDSTSPGSLKVSSILLSGPYDPGQLPQGRASPLLDPLPRPVVAAGAKVGVYAEIAAGGYDARTVSVQIENVRLDRPSGLGKVIGWIGRTIGLANARAPARLAWSFELKPGEVNALPVTLDMGSIEPGRYRLTLTVRDPRTGETVAAEREMLVVRAPTASQP